MGGSAYAKNRLRSQDDPDGVPENIHEMDIMDMNVLDEADMENGGGDEYDEELPDTILDDENVGDLKEDSTNNAEESGDAVVSTAEMEEVRLCFIVSLVLVLLHVV